MKLVTPEQLIKSFTTKPTTSAVYQIDPVYQYVDYTDCDRILAFIREHPNHPLALKLQDAITVIRRQFRQYDMLSLSFNGGKDATVLLHMIRVVCVIISRHNESETPHQIFKRLVKLFVIHTDQQFYELSEFFVSTAQRYNLGIYVYQGTEFRQCLQNFVNDFSCEICFLGVRLGDPTAFSVIQKPSPNWPQIMRCCPLFDFEFVDIFDFLLRFNYKYCELYNKGFTSLGSVGHTFRNEQLTGKEIKQKYEKNEENRVVDVLIQRGITIKKINEQFIDEYNSPAICSCVQIDERVGRK